MQPHVFTVAAVVHAATSAAVAHAAARFHSRSSCACSRKCSQWQARHQIPPAAATQALPQNSSHACSRKCSQWQARHQIPPVAPQRCRRASPSEQQPRMSRSGPPRISQRRLRPQRPWRASAAARRRGCGARSRLRRRVPGSAGGLPTQWNLGINLQPEALSAWLCRCACA